MFDARHFAVFTVFCFVALSGCFDPNQRPRAGVGDPAVFTTLHIAAAEESQKAMAPTTGPTNGTVQSDMLRYLRSRESDYQVSRIRADDMLDSRQGAASVAQLASSALEISAKVAWLKLGAQPPTTQPVADKKPVENAADKKDQKVNEGASANAVHETSAASKGSENASPTTLPTLSSAEKDLLTKALSDLVQDSPTDRVDRAYDFYTSLNTKLLLMFGRDSRVQDPTRLWQAVQRQRNLRAFEKLLAERDELGRETDELKTRSKGEAALLTELKVAEGDLDEIDNVKRDIASKPGTVLRTFPLTGPIAVPTNRLKSAPEAVAQHSQKTRDLNQRVKEIQEAMKKAEEAPNADQRDVATSWPQGVERLLYLSFPVSVSPGTKANQMVGVRIRILGTGTADENTFKKGSADRVKIVSLHPQRTYDLQSELSTDISRSILSVALSGSLGTDSIASPGVTADLKNTSDLQAERRRNFLSRMSKQGAYVDAPNHEFGWTFLPTNIHVDNVSALSGFFRAITFQTPQKFRINAYLDLGVYDCGAYVVVDPTVDWIEFTTDYVYANIDQDGNGGPERRLFIDENQAPRLIQPGHATGVDRPTTRFRLPAESFYELDAAFEQ